MDSDAQLGFIIIGFFFVMCCGVSYFVGHIAGAKYTMDQLERRDG